MIIGLCGLKESGKTTSAKYLESKFGFKRMALADPVKEAARVIFGFTQDQLYTTEGKETIDLRWGFTPRHACQILGTEVGRQFSKDVWINNLKIRCSHYDKVVVEDVRFKNESEFIKNAGGVVIGIRRESLSTDDLHASELEMVENWSTMIDYEIFNVGPLERLYEDLNYVYEEFSSK